MKGEAHLLAHFRDEARVLAARLAADAVIEVGDLEGDAERVAHTKQEVEKRRVESTPPETATKRLSPGWVGQVRAKKSRTRCSSMALDLVPGGVRGWRVLHGVSRGSPGAHPGAGPVRGELSALGGGRGRIRLRF